MKNWKISKKTWKNRNFRRGAHHDPLRFLLCRAGLEQLVHRKEGFWSAARTLIHRTSYRSPRVRFSRVFTKQPTRLGKTVIAHLPLRFMYQGWAHFEDHSTEHRWSYEMPVFKAFLGMMHALDHPPAPHPQPSEVNNSSCRHASVRLAPNILLLSQLPRKVEEFPGTWQWEGMMRGCKGRHFEKSPKFWPLKADLTLTSCDSWGDCMSNIVRHGLISQTTSSDWLSHQ